MPPYSTKTRAQNRRSATSSSHRFILSRTRRTSSSRVVRSTASLTPSQLLAKKLEEEETEIERRKGLTERQVDESLRDVPDTYDVDDVNFDMGNGFEDDVLHGRTQLDISHAGEAAIDETMLEQLHKHHNKFFGRRRDPRTRADRTQKLVDAFATQLEAMADAYLRWSYSTASSGLGGSYSLPEGSVLQNRYDVYVVDMFGNSLLSVLPAGSQYPKDASPKEISMIQGDAFVSSAFTRQGLMPVSPYFPTVAITIRVLEVFRAAHLRCPRLGIQAFVRTLCDLHGIAPRPYLVYQFTVAFDLYLALRAIVDKRVQAELGRDVANWRLKNACPACLYKLEGEPELHIPLLATMDGNNSLKRFARRERETISDDGTTAPGASKERYDDRVPPGDYYLPREEVDRWAKEGLQELMKGFVADPESEEESDGCTERWQNMKEDVTARAWGLYDETGIFISLCRHGFVLVVADMVQSGELAKYGFAVTAHLIRVLREIGLGYDIGCKFGKMVKAHPVLSQLAKENCFTSLVGAFHGHAHNRICQTRFLTTYVKGVGLEDLEGCESFFSKSNALAASTRYATVFHRQQAISTYLEHMDNFDTYQGLSSLLASKYRRALKIKSTLPALQETMESLGVANRETFELWLAQERECLERLSKEPLEETLQMEYYQKLVNLRDHEEHLQAVMGVDMPMMPVGGGDAYSAAARNTSRIETQRRHAQEVYAKTLAAVQDLELRIGVSARWIPGDANWEAASKMVSERRYRRALDNLERLVISRLFELTKVNMAGTGYKLRKHIAKSLQARSKAVKTAILKYNEAAESCTPARPTLTWVEVVEYAFLADFDLLRLGREDVRKELWATPGGRAAMDQHFKILRADEEILRLDLEIPRFVTYMTDEESFLVYHEGRLEQEGKAELAYQVRLLRMKRGRFNAIHMERLVKLSKEPGFSGSITPGVAVGKERRVPVGAPHVAEGMPMTMPIDESWLAEEDDEEETDDEEVSEAFERILHITHDVSDAAAS